MWPKPCSGGLVVSLTHDLLWGLGELGSFERGIGSWTTLSDALDLPTM